WPDVCGGTPSTVRRRRPRGDGDLSPGWYVPHGARRLHRERLTRVEPHGRTVVSDVHVEDTAPPAEPLQGDTVQRAGQNRGEDDPVGAPAQPRVAVQELLQEAAVPGQEREGTPGAGLGELLEGRSDERFDTAPGVLECRLGIA